MSERQKHALCCILVIPGTNRKKELFWTEYVESALEMFYLPPLASWILEKQLNTILLY